MSRRELVCLFLVLVAASACSDGGNAAAASAGACTVGQKSCSPDGHTALVCQTATSGLATWVVTSGCAGTTCVAGACKPVVPPTQNLSVKVLVEPVGGSLVVSPGASGVAGAKVTFAPGAVAKGTNIELVFEAATDEMPLPQLRVEADGPVDLALVTVRVKSEALKYAPAGTKPELWASSPGLPQWVRIDSDAKADNLGADLVASLGKVADGVTAAAKSGIVLLKDGAVDMTEAMKKTGAAIVDGAVAPLKKTVAVISVATKTLVWTLKNPIGIFSTFGPLSMACSNPDAVLVVHGVLSNPENMLKFTAALQQAGKHVILASYPSGDTIEANAGQLAAVVNDWMAKCPAPSKIDAVGHSMGGLVLRSMMQNHGASASIRRLIMLATPNDGGSPDFTVWLHDMGVDSALSFTGIASLAQHSGSLGPLNSLENYWKHRDRYYVLAGWSEKSGAQAEDGWVEIQSALFLDLPPGHEKYMTWQGPVESAGKPPWSGDSSMLYTHTGIHELALDNGIIPIIQGWLTAECQPQCDGKECGDDTCGNSCPPGCGGAATCSDDFQCMVGCVPSCKDKCAGADNGCQGKCPNPCASGLVCVAGGACLAESQCGDITSKGVCNGQVLTYCAGGTLAQEDCAKSGMSCGWNAMYAANSCVTGTCTPKCAGKQCGDDGCGGWCGNGPCSGVAGGMVLIPAGSFKMGCVPGDLCGSSEGPQHTVTLDAYYMDAYEVTVAKYKLCVDAGKCTAPPSSYSDSNWGVSGREQHPVNYVDWTQADMYCKWTDAKGHLPTEAEWEKAARGGLSDKKFPWGDEDATCDSGQPNTAVYWSSYKKDGYGCETGTDWEVGAGSSKNGFGLYDVAGNVWEWVGDWYGSGYYGISVATNPQGPSTGSARVFRGGSYYDYATYMRSSYRFSGDPVGIAAFVGFRCAKSYP